MRRACRRWAEERVSDGPVLDHTLQIFLHGPPNTQIAGSPRYGSSRRTTKAHSVVCRPLPHWSSRAGLSNHRDWCLFNIPISKECAYRLFRVLVLDLHSLQKSAGAAALRTPYLRLIHLEISSPSAGGTGGLNPFGVQFTPEEEEEFGEMARSDGFYERFAKSVAPSIYGSLGQEQCPTLVHFCLTICRSQLRRHQKGNNVSTIWRFEEDITGWHATSWGHQRTSPW